MVWSNEFIVYSFENLRLHHSPTLPAPRTPFASACRCISRSCPTPRHLTPGVRQGGVSGSQWPFCSWEVVTSANFCMMWTTLFSHSFGVELAKINTRLLSKAIYMHHGDRNIIKVRVLEATQTAEPVLPILPVSPCVSKHSESHLAQKHRKAFHVLRRPVLRSRCFPVRLSWEFDHFQSQRAHPRRHHLCLQNQPQRSALMFLQQNARCGHSHSHWCRGLPASIQKCKMHETHALRQVLCCPQQTSAANPRPSAPSCHQRLKHKSPHWVNNKHLSNPGRWARPFPHHSGSSAIATPHLRQHAQQSSLHWATWQVPWSPAPGWTHW